MRYRLDTPRPQRLIELGVEPHICSTHCLLRKVNDRLDCPGSTLLEGTAVNALVQMDGVFTGHHVLQSRARLAGLYARCKPKVSESIKVN